MEIKVVEEGKPCVVALLGRLDTNTSPELEEFAGKLYEKGVADIAVDMAECPFVSSAGLRVIVAMQKRAAASPLFPSPTTRTLPKPLAMERSYIMPIGKYQAKPRHARKPVTIHRRVTTCGSDQPFFSR